MKKNKRNLSTEEIKYKEYLIKLSYRQQNKAFYEIFFEDNINHKLYSVYQSKGPWTTKEEVLKRIYNYIDKFSQRLTQNLQKIKIQTEARKIYY